MTLEEYQCKAMVTKLVSCDNVGYMLINLVGEVGEFSSKLGKAIRKEWVSFEQNELIIHQDCPESFCDELRKEAGDVLWQLTGLCDVFGWDLQQVASENLKKLKSRAQRGVIDGDGDNR